MSVWDVYELANLVARRLEAEGEAAAASEVRSAMLMGSSGLENLGKTVLVLTRHRDELQRRGLVSEDQFAQMKRCVDEAFGRS